MSTAESVKQEYEKSLLKKHGVIGTGIGEKWVDGKPTSEQAILVFVEEKLTKKNIGKFSADDIIPKEIDGIPTDVIEVGTIVKQSYVSKARPIKPGFSVGHQKITAGTMGGLFLDRDGDTVVLSNNHVLACDNAAKIGDPIYQPGTLDNKQDIRFREWPDPVADLPYIGTLKKFVRLEKTKNIQDSAIAKVHQGLLDAGLIDDIYPTINRRLAGFGDPKVGDPIQKCGRTTGYTTGRVIGLQASFSIAFDFGTARFDDCVVMTNISKGGDSGSVITNMDMDAVALLFAGSDRVTIANPIGHVREEYGLELWAQQEPLPVLGNWATRTSRNATLKISDDVIKIDSPGNVYCCLEHTVNNLNSVSCTVNTGTDQGATWGPGLVTQWPNGTLKVNLRCRGSFGGYYNGNYNISIGKTKANTDYGLRIIKTRNSWQGQVEENGIWYTVIAVPLSIFPYSPSSVRIGKTSLMGSCSSYGIAGDRGQCSIRDFKIN